VGIRGQLDPMSVKASAAPCAIVTRTVGGQARRPETNPPTRNENMNALKGWNRLKDLGAFQHGLVSLLGRSSAHWPEGQEEQIAVPEWAPLADISEDDKEFEVKVA
jgi:hypothetical protein